MSDVVVWVIVIAVAAVVYFIVQRRKKGEPVVPAAPVAELSNALQQAIAALHQSVPVKPTIPAVQPVPVTTGSPPVTAPAAASMVPDVKVAPKAPEAPPVATTQTPADADYAARVAERNKNLADWAAHREVPSMSDADSNTVLATFDAEPNAWIKWYHISAKEQLALVNRMTSQNISAGINEYNGANGRNVGVPPGWVGSACQKLRGD